MQAQHILAFWYNWLHFNSVHIDEIYIHSFSFCEIDAAYFRYLFSLSSFLSFKNLRTDRIKSNTADEPEILVQYSNWEYIDATAAHSLTHF